MKEEKNKKEKERNEELKQQMKLFEKLLFKKDLRIFLILFAAIIILVIIILVVALKNKDGRSFSEKLDDTVTDLVIGEEGKVELVTEATLVSAMKNATLYTAEYPYNGVTYVSDKDNGLKYYVSYKANIKAGFNAENVRVTLDKENSIITIRLPEIELSEPSVSGEFKYIFMDEKYNTGDTYNEAFSAAVTDLKKREKTGEFDNIYDAATQNAKIAEKALVEPWVNQVDPDTRYTINVLAYGEEE